MLTHIHGPCHLQMAIQMKSKLWCKNQANTLCSYHQQKQHHEYEGHELSPSISSFALLSFLHFEHPSEQKRKQLDPNHVFQNQDVPLNMLTPKCWDLHLYRVLPQKPIDHFGRVRHIQSPHDSPGPVHSGRQSASNISPQANIQCNHPNCGANWAKWRSFFHRSRIELLEGTQPDFFARKKKKKQ